MDDKQILFKQKQEENKIVPPNQTAQELVRLFSSFKEYNKKTVDTYPESLEGFINYLEWLQGQV